MYGSLHHIGLEIFNLDTNNFWTKDNITFLNNIQTFNGDSVLLNEINAVYSYVYKEI